MTVMTHCGWAAGATRVGAVVVVVVVVVDWLLGVLRWGRTGVQLVLGTPWTPGLGLESGQGWWQSG